MTSRQKKITMIAVLIVALGLLIGSFFLFAPKALRSYCRKQGVEYQYATCRFRLPGTLTFSGFQLQKADEFSFAAEHLEWKGSLWDCLLGRWNAKTLQMNNAALQITQTRHAGKVQLSKITLELQDIAMESRANGSMKAVVDEINLQNNGTLRGGNLEINSLCIFSKEWLLDLLQGQISVSDVILSQGELSLGTLSGTVDYALQQDADDSWQLISGAGEAAPLNQIQVRLSGREVLNALVRSGSWNKASEQQEASLELTASCIDSDPLLALFAPEAYAWASGRLKYLQLDLHSRGRDKEDFLRNIEGSVALDIEQLNLKNSPFIEIFSRRTTLDLPDLLRFEQGSAILKIANQTCRVLTTTPFRGQHPIIEANGTVAFTGRLQVKLDLGFSQELEKLMQTKRYFLPFALLCHRKNGYLMLPGSLTLTGTLDNPSVDLTDLMKASAKAGLKTLFEDAAGRIGIRLQRSDKDAKE